MIKRILLRSAVSILRSLLLAKVNSVDLQAVLNKIIDFLEKVVDKLTDNDKNDKEQIQQIWVEDRLALALTTMNLVDIVIKEKVENPDLREAALIQLNSLKEILETLVDNN